MVDDEMKLNVTNDSDLKEIACVKAGTGREGYERELGRLMHEISKQQTICVAENKKLQDLQNAANKLDEELTKLDGKRDNS